MGRGAEAPSRGGGYLGDKTSPVREGFWPYRKEVDFGPIRCVYKIFALLSWSLDPAMNLTVKCQFTPTSDKYSTNYEFCEIKQ